MEINNDSASPELFVKWAMGIEQQIHDDDMQYKFRSDDFNINTCVNSLLV